MQTTGLKTHRKKYKEKISQNNSIISKSQEYKGKNDQSEQLDTQNMRHFQRRFVHSAPLSGNALQVKSGTGSNTQCLRAFNLQLSV